MTLNDRIKAFVKLGKLLAATGSGDPRLSDLEALISRIHIHNPWFTQSNVRNAIGSIASMLKEERLIDWLSDYIGRIEEETEPKEIAVIMAGNVPLVGFHDLLCVLLSGNSFLGKLSSDDKLLLPQVARILTDIEPRFAGMIQFSEGQIKGMDAVIATGSNNTARYFEYYFGKYPHIIRRNRNSVAVLTGAETEKELNLLGSDIFLYFGLGCRNVSKIFLPRGYDLSIFFTAIYPYSEVLNNNKYGNNYDYNKTVFLMNGTPGLLDNNFLLLKPDTGYSSPIGVLFYEYYDDPETLNRRLIADREQIQCIVSSSAGISGALPFGEAQCPAPGEYADDVDTMDFLIGLHAAKK